VRTDRNWCELCQSPIDPSLVVGAVNAAPIPVDDVGPLTRVLQRRCSRRERRVLRQRECRLVDVGGATLFRQAAPIVVGRLDNAFALAVRREDWPTREQ
jgi:hypothetical protein